MNVAVVSLLVVFAVSFVVSGFIWATKSFQMGALSRRADTRAVQASHVAPTPRLGGVAFVIALAAAVISWGSSDGERDTYLLFISTLLPVFAAGLLEDLGMNVRPRNRLIAAAASGMLVVVFFGFWLPRVDLPVIDLFFTFAPFAILFSLFAAAGVSHAFNLIDGLNGLSTSTAMMVAGALAYVAAKHGVPNVFEACLICMAALGGFLLFNYPFGKVFLGDGGAYSVGHFLGWSAIALVYARPEISAFAVLLIFFWPVADTCFAIYRRRRAGRPSDQPDRLHYHQLVMRALEILLLGRGRRELANPLATAVMLPMIASPMIAGVILVDQPRQAFIAFIGFVVLFVGTYLIGLHLARRIPFRHRKPHPEAADRATHIAAG
ncbi:glycosyltransferase [Pelagovum sp. HNIBRBA483]|uniref:MraY family glycosyltransferase n=1 Tax=Pelagovum sp. HNIBRBA483 TaxID=3233341 RepID=UPI0034A59418